MKRATLAVAMALALAFMGSSAGFASASEPASSTEDAQQCTNLAHPGVAVGVLLPESCDRWQILILPEEQALPDVDQLMVLQILYVAGAEAESGAEDEPLEWAMFEDGTKICDGVIDDDDRFDGCDFVASTSSDHVLEVNNPDLDRIQTYSSVVSLSPT